MIIRDSDIRKSLLNELNNNRKPETIIKPEMQVGYGAAIIDIAVIEDTFYGYEIKSEFDSLQRLKNQIENYDKLISKMSIVLCENHYKKALNIIPEYWGIVVITSENDTVKMLEDRESKENPNREARSLVQLLWRSELLDLIDTIGAEKKLKRHAKYDIWDRITEIVDMPILESMVINYLRNRANWEKPLKAARIRHLELAKKSLRAV